jgi:hypothetical protein
MAGDRRTDEKIRREMTAERAQLEEALADLRRSLDEKRRLAAAAGGAIAAGFAAGAAVVVVRRRRRRR